MGSVSAGESIARSSTEAWGGVGVGPEEAVLREVASCPLPSPRSPLLRAGARVSASVGVFLFL